MLIAGIVAEYNPFHKGHGALLQYCRERGASHVVAVMSGNFVQRGEPALLSKHARAEMAVRNGVDLVIELPVYWALSGAENFALGAVSLLAAAGCQRLCFGSECGDAGLLQEAAAALLQQDFITETRERLKTGLSFAAARNQVWEERFGGPLAGLLQAPNNILGVEYCKALIRLGTAMQPCSMRRAGPGHHDRAPLAGIASGTLLRRMITANENWENYLSAESGMIVHREISLLHAPAATERIENAILAALRKMSPAGFSRLPDISEGLENRLYQAAQAAVSLNGFYRLVKSKRYALSRIRRLAMCAFLGIEAQAPFTLPPYLRVLAMNPQGAALLRAVKLRGELPILTRAAQASQLSPAARALWLQEQQSCNLYNLCLPQPLPCGTDLTQKLFYLPKIQP